MSGAWVTVVGTLGGVVVTAASGLVVARQSARHQRDIWQLERRASADDRLRTERRQAMID